MHRPPADTRAEAVVRFLVPYATLLMLVLGGVWLLLVWFEHCGGVALCSAVPLIRQPHVGSGPRWWQRLVLRLRVLRLQARHRAMLSDVGWLQRELALTRNLLDACQADADESGEQIAWARSDLAKLQ